MLEGLVILGCTSLSRHRSRASGDEETLLRALVQVSQANRYDQLVHLKLTRVNGQWHLEADLQDVDVEALHQTLWLGHADRNRIQDRVTVSNLAYLISQALPALAGRLTPGLPDDTLRAYLDRVLEEVALELPVGKKSSGQRYRWVWNLPALGYARWEWVPKGRRKELEALAQDEDAEAPTSRVFRDHAAKYGAQRTISLMADMLQTALQETLGLNRRGNYLYTLHLEDRWLVREPAYHRYLYRYYIEDLFAKTRSGLCYLCGQKKPQVTEDTTRLWLKFYITDKPGFASGFRKENFYRNYTLCRDCYQTLLAGEAFLRTRLGSWLGTQVYVLPVFYFPEVQPTSADLEEWAEYVAHRWEASLTLKGWQAFQEQLDAYREFENQKAWFLLDFLFVEDDGRSIKLQHYIQDVPPPRLDALDEARHRTRTFAKSYFRDSSMWDLSFSMLYYLFPIRQRGQGRQAFFQFLNALLHERPVDFRYLIPLFLETASVHCFQKYGAYVQRPPENGDNESALRFFLVQTQLLRYDLLLLGLLSPSGGFHMSDIQFADEIRRLVPEEVWAYMDALRLNLPQRALFLLGYLVGEVAHAQQQAGSVTILNRIHFQGMGEGKVRRLSNEMLDQLRIYRVLYPTTRDLFSAMRSLMDQAGQLLPPAENTYWVLSGYAFRHLRRFGQAEDTASQSR